MKRLAILVLALSLTACASMQNPVSRNTLVTAESGYGVVLSAAVAYRKLCADKAIARAKCAPVVASLQAADRKVQVALKNLRAFVKNNPTVDATSLIIAVKDAVDDFQAIASVNGVK